jgi:hypothetical protein
MTKLTKFFPTTEEVQDLVIWVDDIEEAVREKGYAMAMGDLMDRVILGDLRCSGYVHVIDDDKDLAKTMAYALEEEYKKELELMKNIKGIAKEEGTVKEEKTLLTTATEEEKKAASIAKSDAAKKFAQKHAPKAKEKVEDKKEEIEVKKEEKKEVKGARRRLNTGVAQEENQVETKTTEKDDVKVNKPNRKSTSRVLKTEEKKPAASGAPRKKLGTSKSIKSEFVKFEGPWYLNDSLYSVLKRFGQIIENLQNGDFADEELGIDQLVVVDPQDIRRYADRSDILLVIQVKSNGNILEFPIKQAKGNSSSDLNSSSIGWIETKNGLRPAFGQWVVNEQAVDVKCECGHEFQAHPSYIYCEKCDSLYSEIEVKSYKGFVRFFTDEKKFQAKKVINFVAPSNIVIPRETLALVMAIAQNELDLDMWGVGEEDAE